MDIIRITLGLPSSESTDVVKKVIRIERDTPVEGELPASESHDLAPGASSFDVEAVQDTDVTVELVAVDDGGNESDVIVATFTAVDTVPPILEGGITAAMTGERSIPDSVDPVDPTPAEGSGDPIIEEPPTETSPDVDPPTETSVEDSVEEPEVFVDDALGDPADPVAVDDTTPVVIDPVEPTVTDDESADVVTPTVTDATPEVSEVPPTVDETPTT